MRSGQERRSGFTTRIRIKSFATVRCVRWQSALFSAAEGKICFRRPNDPRMSSRRGTGRWRGVPAERAPVCSIRWFGLGRDQSRDRDVNPSAVVTHVTGWPPGRGTSGFGVSCAAAPDPERASTARSPRHWVHGPPVSATRLPPERLSSPNSCLVCEASHNNTEHDVPGVPHTRGRYSLRSKALPRNRPSYSSHNNRVMALCETHRSSSGLVTPRPPLLSTRV